MSTLPFFSNVAVWLDLLVIIKPVALNEREDGLYKFVSEPATRTSPLGRTVAVWPNCVEEVDPVVVNVPWGTTPTVTLDETLVPRELVTLKV
jgi:hypothetical protein